jgi:OPA family glycerol-3-phosphate transporter-like MFS transporter
MRAEQYRHGSTFANQQPLDHQRPLLATVPADRRGDEGGGDGVDDDPRRRKWELIACATLAIAYSLTVSTSRNALFTAKSSIAAEFGPNAYGNINSVVSGWHPLLALLPSDRGPDMRWILQGYATYGVGKLVYGVAVDLPSVGGRLAFLYCMVGTGVFTSLMSFASTELQFALAWGLARATQASGWIAMIKIVTAWTPASRLGRVMSGLSLAAYLGDFATRLLIGAVLAAGVNWRSIFWMAGATIGALFLVTLALLRPSPEGMGLAPVPLNPHRVVRTIQKAGDGSAEQPQLGCAQTLRLLCASSEFWVVCLLSVCLQTAREAFNTNSADLLASQGATDAAAAALSSAFPLMGVPACLFFGWLIDRYDRRRNGEILAISLTLLLLMMGLLCGWLWEPGLGLAFLSGVRSDLMVAVLLLAAGFALIGPYSLLAGVFAGDLGGPAAAATACSLIDFAGYCGSIVLMLVGGRGPFVSEEHPYLLLFLVFGLGTTAASVALSAGLICIKRRKVATVE